MTVGPVNHGRCIFPSASTADADQNISPKSSKA